MNHVPATTPTFVVFVVALEQNGLRFFVDQKPPMVSLVLSLNEFTVLALSRDDPVSLLRNDLVDSFHVVLRIHFLDPFDQFVIRACP